MDEFIRKDVFDISIQRLEALMALNLTEQKAMNERLEARIDVLDSRIDVLSERIDKNLAQYEAIASNIEGDIKAMNARLDTQQTKFGWYLTIFGLIITVAVAAIQLWK